MASTALALRPTSAALAAAKILTEGLARAGAATAGDRWNWDEFARDDTSQYPLTSWLAAKPAKALGSAYAWAERTARMPTFGHQPKAVTKTAKPASTKKSKRQKKRPTKKRNWKRYVSREGDGPHLASPPKAEESEPALDRDAFIDDEGLDME
jgi:hypothetical protein